MIRRVRTVQAQSTFKFKAKMKVSQEFKTKKTKQKGWYGYERNTLRIESIDLTICGLC